MSEVEITRQPREEEDAKVQVEKAIERAYGAGKWMIVICNENDRGGLDYDRLSSNFPNSKLKEAAETICTDYNEIMEAQKIPEPPVRLPLAPHLQDRIEKDNTPSDGPTYDPATANQCDDPDAGKHNPAEDENITLGDG